MLDALSSPWPWYVAGPLIGLFVPALLLIGGRRFGVSDNLRHLCAAILPAKAKFLRYDWKTKGTWNLLFMVGIIIGASLASTFFHNPEPISLSAATRADLTTLGISSFDGLVPRELFSWSTLTTVPGFVLMVVGGFLVGFGSKYAGGCTSGHAISGLADLQGPSLLAVMGFFAGGLVATYLLLPLILG